MCDAATSAPLVERGEELFPSPALLFARERYLAGAGQVQHSKGFHQVQELLNLALVARHLDGKALGLNIHNLSPKDVSNLHDLRASFGINGNLHQDQLAVDVFTVPEVDDLEDVSQFIQLFDDL